MKFDGIEKEVVSPYCECPDENTWVLIYEHQHSNKVQAQWAPVSKEAVSIVKEMGLILECEFRDVSVELKKLRDKGYDI